MPPKVKLSKETVAQAAKQSNLSVGEYLDKLPSSYYEDAAKQSNMDVKEYVGKLKSVWGGDTEPVKKKDTSKNLSVGAANVLQTSPSKLASGSSSTDQIEDTNKPLTKLSPNEKFAANLKTNDGIEFPALSIPENIRQGIQQRIASGNTTTEDVEVIAKNSGKSANVINSYLKLGAQKGSAIENLETEGKLNEQLANSVKDFNKEFGTNYNADEVLSSSQKTQDFFHKMAFEATKQQYQKSQELKTSQPFSEANVPLQKIKEKALGEELNALNQRVAKYQSLLKDHLVNMTILEDKENGIPAEQTINKLAKTLNPEGYKQSVQVSKDKVNPSNQFELAGAGYDYLVGNAKEKEDLLNSVKGGAEIKYNEGLKRFALNKISTAIVTNNKKLYEEGQVELKHVDDNVIYKYPSLVQREIARQVSEKMAQESGQLVGTETQDGKLLQKTFGGSAADHLRTLKELGFLDNPKTKDIALSMVGRNELFADASYFGSVAESFIDPFKNLAKTAGYITGFRNQKDLYTDKLRDEQLPKEMQGLKESVAVVRNAANTTANLAGMIVISAATEGLGTEAGLSSNVTQKLGSYTSFGLPSYDQSLKDSYDFLNSSAARHFYATFNAIANAEGGRLLDLGKITRIPGMSNSFAKVALGISEESMSKSVAKELLNEGKNKFIDFAVKYGKNVTKGAATMAYFNTTNNVLKLAFGDPNTKAEDILPNAAHAFVDGITGMSIMGAFGAVADMRNEKNTIYKGNIYDLAINHDAASDILNKSLKIGLFNEQQFNEKMQILNTAKAAKNTVDVIETERNVSLNPSQKAVWVSNKTAENFIKSKIEKTSDEQLKNKYQSQVDRLSKQNEDILNGLKFNSVLEPLYNLHEAEKEYNKAQEEFNASGTEDDTKLLKAKERYDNLYSQYFEKDKRKADEEVKSTEVEKAGSEDSKGETPKSAEAKTQIDFTGKDNNFLANKEPDFFTAEERVKYNDLMGKTDTEDQAAKMVSDRKNELIKKSTEISDAKIIPTFESIKPILSEGQINTAQPIIDRVNNAEYINEKELNAASDVLYDALDKSPEAAHLIEPLILKLEDYEFATKTETSTVTKKVPIEGSFKVNRPKIKPVLERSAGNEATVTDKEGNKVEGNLSIKDGNYVLTDKQGNETILGEKQVTDRDTKYSHEDNPIIFNKSGGIESITFDIGKVDMKEGGNVKDKTITINFDEKNTKAQDQALDLSIQLKAQELGSIPNEAFEQAYKEEQKEISKEVPVKDIYSQTKTTTDEKSDDKINNDEKSGKEINAKEGSREKNDEEGLRNDVIPPLKGAEKEAAPLLKHEVKYNESTKQFDVVSDKGSVIDSYRTYDKANEVSNNLNEDLQKEPPLAKPPIKNNIKDDESDKVGITKKDLAELSDKYDIELEKRRDVITDDEMSLMAKDLIEKGYDVDRLIKKSLADEKFVPSDIELNVLAEYAADMKAKIDENSSNADIKKYNDILSAIERSGSEIGRALRALKVKKDAVDSIADVMSDMIDDYKVDELTPEQRQEAEKRFNEIKEKLDTETKMRIQAQKEIEKLKAESEILKAKKDVQNKPKKKNEDYKSERENIIKSIKDKWNKAGEGGETYSSVIPLPINKIKQLVAISPDVAKLIGSYLEQGAAKTLDEIRSLLKKDIENVGIEISDDEVRGLIAGNYNEKKSSKNDLKNDIQDLRREEKLLLELEGLQSGKEMNNDKKQIERNQKLTAIRTQINDIQKNLKVGKYSVEEKISQRIKNNKKRQFELEKKLKEGDFENPILDQAAADLELLKKNNKKLYDEYLHSIVEKENALYDYEKKRIDDKSKNRSIVNKLLDIGDTLLTTSKGTVAMFDQSVVLVQALLFSGAHPIKALQFATKAIRNFASKSHFDKEVAELHESDFWDVIKQSDLAVYEPRSVVKELRNEMHGGEKNLWNKDIVINGKNYSIGQAFERSTSTYLNNARLWLFKNQAAKLYEAGKDFKSHPQEFKAAARVINEFTGYGKVQQDLAKASNMINKFIWSPKMFASTLNVLGLGDIIRPLGENKGFYRSLTPEQRSFAVKELAKFIGAGLSIMAISKLTGLADDIDIDPRSSGFGTVTKGDKNVNLFGRFGSAIRTVVQVVGGERIINGKADVLGDRYGEKTRGDVFFGSFVRGKMTPAAGIAYDYILNNKKNYYTKEKLDAIEILKNMAIPLAARDIKKDLDRDGLIKGMVETIYKIYGGNIKDARDFEEMKKMEKENKRQESLEKYVNRK